MELHRYLHGTDKDGDYGEITKSDNFQKFLTKELGIKKQKQLTDVILGLFASFDAMEGYEKASIKDKPKRILYAPLYLDVFEGMPTDIQAIAALGSCGIECRGCAGQWPDKPTDTRATYGCQIEMLTLQELLGDHEGSYLDFMFGVLPFTDQELHELRNFDRFLDDQLIPQRVAPVMHGIDKWHVFAALDAMLEGKNIVIRLEPGVSFNNRAREVLIQLYALLPPQYAVRVGYSAYQKPEKVKQVESKWSVRVFVVPGEESIECLEGPDYAIIDFSKQLQPKENDELWGKLEQLYEMPWEERFRLMGNLFADVTTVENREFFISRLDTLWRAQEEYDAWTERYSTGRLSSLIELKSAYDGFSKKNLILDWEQKFKEQISHMLRPDTDFDRLVTQAYINSVFGENDEKMAQASMLYEFGSKYAQADLDIIDEEYDSYYSKHEEAAVNEALGIQKESLDEQKRKEIESLKKDHEQKLNEKEDALNKEIKAHTNDVIRLNGTISEQKTTIEEKDKEYKKLEDEKKKTESDLQETNRNLVQAKEDCRQANQDYENEKYDHSITRRSLENVKQEKSKLDESLNKAKDENKSLNDKLEKLQKKQEKAVAREGWPWWAVPLASFVAGLLLMAMVWVVVSILRSDVKEAWETTPTTEPVEIATLPTTLPLESTTEPTMESTVEPTTETTTAPTEPEPVEFMGWDDPALAEHMLISVDGVEQVAADDSWYADDIAIPEGYSVVAAISSEEEGAFIGYPDSYALILSIAQVGENENNIVDSEEDASNSGISNGESDTEPDETNTDGEYNSSTSDSEVDTEPTEEDNGWDNRNTESTTEATEEVVPVEPMTTEEWFALSDRIQLVIETENQVILSVGTDIMHEAAFHTAAWSAANEYIDIHITVRLEDGDLLDLTEGVRPLLRTKYGGSYWWYVLEDFSTESSHMTQLQTILNTSRCPILSFKYLGNEIVAFDYQGDVDMAAKLEEDIDAKAVGDIVYALAPRSNNSTEPSTEAMDPTETSHNASGMN